MPLKRALMILAASCEFDKRHNSEIIERVTDNEQVPMVSYLIKVIMYDKLFQVNAEEFLI